METQKTPQPEPTVTPSATIPSEPVITVPSSTTAQQQSVITVQTQYDHLELGVPGTADMIIDRPEVAIEYFVPDERKAGGAYVTMTGVVRNISVLV